MTDQDLLTTVQVAVIEPPDGGQNWPSDLWTRDEVLDALTERQDRLVKETHLRVLQSVVLVTATTHRVTLPTDTIRVLSVVWRGDDGRVREVLRSESFEVDHLLTTWETTGAVSPLVYMEFDTPNRQIQLAPAPTVDGRLELYTIAAGTPLTGANVPLSVPDELATPVLKYGVLADLLSKDGRGKDAGRAAYCEDRFQLGIEVTRILLKGWA